MTERGDPFTYRGAGVDVEAAERLVSRFAQFAASTRRPEVIADIGPFAGLFRLGREYRDPVLVASTDSVGTKVKLAALLGRYESVGHDLVNHCVNDILTAGAVPLFFLDYIGNYGLSDDAKAAVVRGVAEACRGAGCALIGGETADMPGTYAEGDFDLVGFIVGVVEREAIIDPSRVIREGDRLLALPSNGLHTNGYSLVRRVFGVGLGGDPEAERAVLNSRFPGLESSLGDALLEPHRSYLEQIRPLLPTGTGRRDPSGRLPVLKGLAHITGGGIPGNLPRILPGGLGARVDRSAWTVPPLFRLIQEQGKIAEEEMYRTFNMGVGVVLVVAPEHAEAVRARLPEAFVIGDVVRGAGVEWAA